MNAIGVLAALEKEKSLLEDMICLAGEQLCHLEHDDIDAFDALLDQRSKVMAGLTAIDETLAPWIEQIRTDPSVSEAAMKQVQTLNDEISCMANHIVLIDEAACNRLEAIKNEQRLELREIERRGYC